MQACEPSTWQAAAGGSAQGKGQCGLQSESLFQKQNKTIQIIHSPTYTRSRIVVTYRENRMVVSRGRRKRGMKSFYLMRTKFLFGIPTNVLVVTVMMVAQIINVLNVTEDVKMLNLFHKYFTKIKKFKQNKN